MEISRNEVMLLLIMALAIVSMSMVFPALGLSDNQVTASEIPSFTVNGSRFAFAGDVPPAPGSPSSTTLTYRNNSESINQLWLSGDTGGGVELFLAPPGYSDPDFPTRDDPVLVLNEWSGGNITYTAHLEYTNSSAVYVNDSLGYKLEYIFLEDDDSAGVYSARVTVVAEVADAGWLSDVPLLGSAIEAGQATAATLWWFIEVAIWGLTYFFQQAGNFIGVTVDVVIYLIYFVIWMATTYTGIVSSAQTWAATFVALPGIVFSALLAKVIFIGMSTLAELR